MPSESDLEIKRLRAMNEELRQALDLASMSSAKPPELPSNVDELAALRESMREAEARRLLERSEEEARYAREQAAHRETRAAHDLTAKRLLTLTESHEHATKLLADLQRQHDAAVAARQAAEKERDRLAQLLASRGEDDDQGSGDSGELQANVAIVLSELAEQEASALKAAAAAAERLSEREAELTAEHEAAIFAKDHEVSKCVAQVHRALAAEAAANAGLGVLKRELPPLEAALASATRGFEEQRERCAEAVRQYEAEAAESLRLEGESANAERAREEAEERAKRLSERLDEVNRRRLAAEELAARGEAALKRLTRAEGELLEARKESDRLRRECGRLGVEATEREKKHEAALKAVREQAKEGLKMRETLLKEAVGRAKAAEEEAAELRSQAESAEADADSAREGEELALSQVQRLERQLEALRKEMTKKDDALQAMARRLEVLAGTSTEANMHDMGYWAERGKRTDFATAAYTVGHSKKMATRVAKVLLENDKALGLDHEKATAGSGTRKRFAETAPLATVPFKEPFVIYLARFLLRYDEASATWYKAASEALPSAWAEEKKRAALNEALGEFAASLSFRLAPLASKAGGAGTMTLWEGLHASYSSRSAEAPAQLALLFSLLEPSQQPVEAMKGSIAKLGGGGGDASGTGAGATSVAELVRSLERSADELLPSSLRPRYDESLSAFRLPSVELEQAVDGAPGLLGSIARAPLTVEKQLLPAEYGLFALSGGFGCAATHLAVVPLDVVKTRLQTRPGVYGGFADALTRIRKEEGLGMLFQGAQATGGGYFMYGVSVYPGYELAKRLLFEAAGPTATMEWRVPLVLLAGALATIVTCFLITPFEALRIRQVECPNYAPNFGGALQRYVSEGGWASLYDGLIPLLVRQVLFGMVKFLIFDTCADYILGLLPAGASDDQLVSLGVSLLSGAIAGVGAACISQPADVVLSKVAQGDGSKSFVGRLPGSVNQLALLQQKGAEIVRKYGVAGLYLGLPSRCLWSGAIIAGQFFLYDVFKQALHVTAADLTLFYDALGATVLGATGQL